MCGIAGIIGSDARDLSRMESMLGCIRHRGPDDSGILDQNGVLLGHRRLSIIDLDGGHQPLVSADGSVSIVFNGEIYNYKEQRALLEEKGRRVRTDSDTEVIVQLYQEFGKNCLDHLRGMFAFAIWDQNDESLFAARDHLGQKPLFYSEGSDQLLFASEIKALLAARPSLAVMDTESLDQYLSFRIIVSPRTMFREIRKLPPGHALKYSQRDGLETYRYWDLDYEPKYSDSEDELVERLEAQLIDALRHHIVSDVPVGAFMSGGLDSTLVVSMLMKHVVKEPIQTFSVGLPYRQFDEAPYARMVAERYGTKHREKIIVPSLIGTLPKLVWHLDEPSDPLSVCTYLISEMASQHVKVVLGGDGGDELFGGYDRYYGNLYAGLYAQIPAGLRKRIIGPILRRLPGGGWYKSRAHQARWLHRLSFLDGAERYAASLGYFYFDFEQREQLYGPAIGGQFRQMDPSSSIREPFEHAGATELVDRMLYADSQARLPDHPVMILDRMTMAHSLEARSPFMDHRLAEFAARLPVEMKVRGRSLRRLQMRLAQRYLPDQVLARPKQGFSSALPYMLGDEYSLLYERLLRDSHLGRDGFYRQIQINALVDQHNRGDADHGNRLWLLINSEVWYRMFIEGMSTDDINRQTGAT
jgi:asparagine synthase (glutamine-hydrolysing)